MENTPDITRWNFTSHWPLVDDGKRNLRKDWAPINPDSSLGAVVVGVAQEIVKTYSEAELFNTHRKSDADSPKLSIGEEGRQGIASRSNG